MFCFPHKTFVRTTKLSEQYVDIHMQNTSTTNIYFYTNVYFVMYMYYL